MSEPMSTDELKACRERAEGATPGPWEVSRRDDVMGGFDYFVEAGPLCVAVAAEDARPTRGMGAKRDAAFIAHARTDVPLLLATVAALESDLFRVAEALGRVQYPDGHAPFRGSVEDMVSRAEELTRAENARGDAVAARDAQLEAVADVLSAHGCDCECGCDSDGHTGDDCDPCLGCRIESAMKGARR